MLRDVPIRAAVLLLISFAASSASACSCWLESLEVKRERATAVFDGVVVGKRVVVQNDPVRGRYAVNEYAFAATRVWKGSPSQTLTVRGGVACAIEFSPGRRYVVFAAGPAERMHNMGCGPSALYEDFAKYTEPEESLGPPLARFSAPSTDQLPNARNARWYTYRAQFIVGLTLLEDAWSLDSGDDVTIASTGIAITAVLAALFLLVGAAANFRHRKRALVLLLLAIIISTATIFVAGRVYLSHIPYTNALHWE
jgi:hypothetical protein